MKPGTRFSGLCLLIEVPRLQTTGSTKHDDRRVLLVFGRRRDLRLGQFERDAVTLAGDAAETQRAPFDNDLPAADAKETAEIDHRSAHIALTIHDCVDDAPHILVRRAANLAAENAVGILGTNHGN